MRLDGELRWYIDLMSSAIQSPRTAELRPTEEVRLCGCGCEVPFVCNKRSPRMYLDRAHAARANASSAKRPRHYRRKTAGFKERGISGLSEVMARVREFEDKQIAAGKMPPRKSLRELSALELQAAQRKKAAQKK